jgi:hypothetical protein
MAILQLASDTLAVTAGLGQMEYNGKIQTFTPLGTQRGVIPNEQFFRLDAGLAGANSTAVQSIFGVGVTLSASTIYEFEYEVVLVKTAGTTSHTFSAGFGGTATINNFISFFHGANTGDALPVVDGNTVALRAMSNAVTSLSLTFNAMSTASRTIAFLCKGTVSVNASGTFIPQYTLSAAPGGAYTTQAGSYMKIKPIGTSGANVSVGAWS